MSARLVKVWDPFVRIFHWSLVALFTLGYLTGEVEGPVHVWAGYGILALIALRVIWGFVGSEHARFSDFVRSPAAAFGYLKGLVKGNAPRTLGHNPAAGWMILLLLASVLATGGSGLVVLGLEGEGPLAGKIAADGWITGVGNALGEGESHDSDDDEDDEEEHGRHGKRMSSDDEGTTASNGAFESAEDAWEEIHEFFANFTVLLVLLHIAGAIASSIAHRENLVRSMFTGLKRE